jgi:hypothetical protein
MKKLLIIISALLFLIYFTGCSDDDNNPANPIDNTELNLDSDLIGNWTFVDSNDDLFGWTFNADGSCVQTQYNLTYNWNWTIENDQLKLYLPNGNPAYYTYKIEGNKLYLWVDVINDWGLPFTKQ